MVSPVPDRINPETSFTAQLAGRLKLHELKKYLIQYKKRLILAMVIATLVFAWFNPSKFASWWLTKDQQGYILFVLEKYELASQRFSNTRWKAFSLYGAEKYDQSAILYGQFDAREDLLARANAMAHGEAYVKARELYNNILDQYPDDEAAKVNLAVVNAIIEDINIMSEGQKAEKGDSPKELGDKPQRADGAKKQEARKNEVEQLSAEQLLLDPQLNEMWMRQVQKTPGLFLSVKFQMQSDQAEKAGNEPSVQETGGNE